MKKKILLLAGLIFIIGSVFGQKNKGKGEQKFDKRLYALLKMEWDVNQKRHLAGIRR